MRKIFLTVLAFLAFSSISAANAQEESPSFMDKAKSWLEKSIDIGNEAVGDMAPVITSCTYGNTTQPVEELCSLLEGGGLVAGIGKPDTRIGLLLASLTEVADYARKPADGQEAEKLINGWYDQLGIALKRCSTSPGQVIFGGARAGFCADTQVSVIYKALLAQCTDGTTTACDVTWEEWMLVAASLDLVKRTHPSEHADWTALEAALNAYSAKEE